MVREHEFPVARQDTPSRCAPSVELLESRLLMDVTVTLSRRGRLNIIAPAGDTVGDLVEVVRLNERTVQVYVNNAIVDPTPRGTGSTTIRRNRIRRILADMGGGDDRVFVGSRADTPRPFRNRLFVRATLVGGDGNDTLQGGPQNDLIIGGAGDDILLGDRRNDVVFGGSGNDQIFGEGGRDNLFGQDGDDFIDGGGNEDHLYGLAGADNLIGGQDDDFLNAAPGPGDIQDRIGKPDAGETRNVFAYVDKLIRLGVPDRFRAVAKS